MKTNKDYNHLTKRELEVLRELADGQFYKEIADKFDVCIDTVKKHCKNIYKKLDVNNRTEATKIYHEQRYSEYA